MFRIPLDYQSEMAQDYSGFWLIFHSPLGLAFLLDLDVGELSLIASVLM